MASWWSSLAGPAPASSELPGRPASSPFSTLASGRWTGFGVYACILLAGYAGAFLALYRFAQANDLYSYALLVPFLSVYLVWTDRRRLPDCGPRRALGLAALF